MDQNLDTEAETLTKTLCGYLAAAQFGDLSAAAKHEARRGVLDWIGCALAGSGHKTITTLLAVLQEISGRPQATVFGRKLRLGLTDAPLANGQMGHVLDYDDTHMGGVVLHTSSPVLAALFALAERAPVSGADFMLAYATGFEAGVRSGRTAPGHHKGGWHLTGTLGTIAAGAACGKLLKLDRQRLTYTLGIAATQAAGMQQNRGTMGKSFHAGKAAANGVLAALLAERGFDSTQEIIEGKKGFCPHLQRRRRAGATDRRARPKDENGWVIETNGHKPYACGVVLHPLIDAVIALRNREAIDPAAVSEIALSVHPLVLSITGVVEPSTGLQSKFSHGAFGGGGVDRRLSRRRAIFRCQGRGPGRGGAAPQGESGRRRHAAQGRGLRGDHRRRQAPRHPHRACQRHRRQPDERRRDRSQIHGQCGAGHRPRARRTRARFRPCRSRRSRTCAS